MHPHLAGIVGQYFVAVVSLYAERRVFEGLDNRPLQQDGLLLCVRVRQCALPPYLARYPRAPGAVLSTPRYQASTSGNTQCTGSGRPKSPPEKRVQGTAGREPHSSRTTSWLTLSGRRRTKLGWRSRPSRVQLLNTTSATRLGWPSGRPARPPRRRKDWTVAPAPTRSCTVRAG